MKIFSVVASVSAVFTSAAAILGIIGIVITGLYPGIIVLCLLALIPIASKSYLRKNGGRSQVYQRNYLIALTFLNLLSILIVMVMTFVILVDRVFPVILK